MLRVQFIAAMLLAGLACDFDRTAPIPPGTPDCVTICEMAWPCGAVLENDLPGCIRSCNDRDHEAYRGCVYTNECETMPDCKLYAPAIVAEE